MVGKWWKKELQASYTVEATGVMALLFFVLMVLIEQAFSMRAETVGGFVLHEQVERERHAILYQKEKEISRKASGEGWELEITSSVFRPEESLRLWSLAEDLS